MFCIDRATAVYQLAFQGFGVVVLLAVGVVLGGVLVGMLRGRA